MEKLQGKAEKAAVRQYEKTNMKRELVFNRLRKEGCRITRQRELILDTILQEDCASCKEIYYKVQEKDKKIGPATIYRMVNTLEKVGAISRKNMYRISEGEGNSCRIKLSDDTVLKLGQEDWKAVIRSGMRSLGYIQEDQDIRSIEMCSAKHDT